MKSVYAVLKKVKADVLLFLFNADLSGILSFTALPEVPTLLRYTGPLRRKGLRGRQNHHKTILETSRQG